MKDFSKYEEYELSEADIDKAIHILTVYNGKEPTPEEAIDYLIWMRTQVHLKAENLDTKKLVEMYNLIKKQGNEQP